MSGKSSQIFKTNKCMEFGKLTNISTVDFKLPADAPETARILGAAAPRVGLPRVYVGCTGWAMKDWCGWVYPKACKSTDYLKYYGQQFNTIELNTTHYRTPSFADIEKWHDQTPADFRFAPKMLQTVSHSKNLGYGTGLTGQFCEAILGLEEKLGVCFMQLPEYFKASDLPIFEKYCAKFNKSVPFAVELRGTEWFIFEENQKKGTPQYKEDFFKILEENKMSTVITDVSGRRDVLHQRLTTPTAIIRFVGNDLHPTDFTRLDEWVERLKSWFELGLHEVYFFTHEPDNLNAPHLSKYFKEKIEASFPAILRGPKFLDVEQKPIQTSLF
jgi:uncharacterized protein YecE (DUF72 family)